MRPLDPFTPRLQLPKGWDRVQVEAQWPGALDEPIKRDWCGLFYIVREGIELILTFEDDTPSPSCYWDRDNKVWKQEP